MGGKDEAYQPFQYHLHTKSKDILSIGPKYIAHRIILESMSHRNKLKKDINTLNLVFSLFFLILTEEASLRRAMKRNSLIS